MFDCEHNYTWYFSCISRMETENSVIVQLSVLNRRLRKVENNSSSLMQASRSSLFKNKEPHIGQKLETEVISGEKRSTTSISDGSLFTWKITDDDDDSPCFEEPNPEPLHRRKRIFVTGIQDRLSNADNNAFGILCLAASLFSKAAKNSLYCTRTDIDWRRRSLKSALDILGSLKWVTTNVT